MSGAIKKHDKVTVNTERGIGVGHVHTVVSINRFFVQIHVGTAVINKYLDTADEGKVWVRGHDVELLQSALTSEAMK